MGQGNDISEFGWSEIIAAALAVGVTTLAAPAPAAEPPKSEEHDDWNFLWVSPQPSAPLSFEPIVVTDARLLPLSPLPAQRRVTPPAELTAPADQDFSRRIEDIPVGVRFVPPVTGAPGAAPSIAVREDRWTITTLDGVARVSAYARGPLDVEDAAQLQTPAPFPRAVGTGLSFITDTPVYIGAAVKTDRSIYDIDVERFRGARWTTSVFVGADTSLGPVYLGTAQAPDGARGAYLYLGRWF
jgi:hypothetical protein